MRRALDIALAIFLTVAGLWGAFEGLSRMIEWKIARELEDAASVAHRSASEPTLEELKRAAVKQGQLADSYERQLENLRASCLRGRVDADYCIRSGAVTAQELEP